MESEENNINADITEVCRLSLLSVEMYAGRVANCILVSPGEYADGTDRQTDERQTVTLRFVVDTASVKLQCICSV